MTILARVFETIMSKHNKKYINYQNVSTEAVERMRNQMDFIKQGTGTVINEIDVDNENVIDQLFDGIFEDSITFGRIIAFFTGARHVLINSKVSEHHFQKILNNINVYLDPWFAKQRTWYYKDLWSQQKRQLFNNDIIRIFILILCHRAFSILLEKIYFWYFYL